MTTSSPTPDDAPSGGGPAVTLEAIGNVALVRLDDGKANALSHEVLEQLSAALAEAADSDALALVGRPGRFCAGFDLSVVREGPAAAAELMGRGAGVALQLFEWPHPTVLGVTGHALAMGAVILCCGDVRVGAPGDHKIGFNEVAIGLAMPEFAIESARARLATTHFHDAVALARIYSPAEAATMGFLDELTETDAVVDRSVERATELGAYLDQRAFARTKATLRTEVADRVRTTLGDLEAVSAD